MDHSNRQKVEEQELFQRFLLARGVDLDIKHLAQPDPPQPDLLYPMPGEGTTAFELVEIKDEGSARRLDRQIQTQRVFSNTYSALPRSTQAALNGLSIVVGFREDLTSHNAKRTIGEIADLVARDSSRSEQTFRSTRSLARCVSFLRVSPNGLPFPMLHVSSFGTYGDNILARINEKLSKQYVAKHPVELLAWYGHQGSATFEIHRREQLRTLVQDRGGCTPFRRIWVFSSSHMRALAVHPELDAATLGVPLFREEL